MLHEKIIQIEKNSCLSSRWHEQEASKDDEMMKRWTLISTFPRFPTIESTPRGYSRASLALLIFSDSARYYLSLPSQPSTIISIMFSIRTAFREYGSPWRGVAATRMRARSSLSKSTNSRTGFTSRNTQADGQRRRHWLRQQLRQKFALFFSLPPSPLFILFSRKGKDLSSASSRFFAM